MSSGHLLCVQLLLKLCAAVHLMTRTGNDRYSEELLIERLKSGHLLKQFRFVITSDGRPGLDYALFPRIVSELVTKHHIKEFHLSLTQGFWRSGEWGIAPQPAVPSGAQLNVVDERWMNFVNSMNGIFCASLLGMLPTYITDPQFTFSPDGYVDPKSFQQIRYGALSGETVCTENFTPWRKLLPCKQTGLSTLINPIRMYESVFHSLSVHYLHVCEDGTVNCGTRKRLELILNFVSDLDLKSRKLDWSFRSIFGRRIDQKCMVADQNIVLFEIDQKNVIQESQIIKHSSRMFSVYNISTYPPNAYPIDIGAKYENRLELPVGIRPTLVTIRSYVTGTDQQSGRLTNILSNGQFFPQRVLYTHVIPWFVRIYYHTISFSCQRQGQSQEHFVKGEVNRKVFVPAKDRQRPFLLEWDVTLPAISFCDLSFEFDKAFLRVNEYPPDANHGFYIPASVITLNASGDLWHKNRTAYGDSLSTVHDELLYKKSSRTVRMYGEAVLILLPVPDFSMPFNVICLVCTVMAMLFGPVHTLTTKMIIPLMEEDKDLAPVPLPRRFLIFICESTVQRIVTKIRRKFTEKKKKNS